MAETAGDVQTSYCQDSSILLQPAEDLVCDRSRLLAVTCCLEGGAAHKKHETIGGCRHIMVRFDSMERWTERYSSTLVLNE